MGPAGSVSRPPAGWEGGCLPRRAVAQRQAAPAPAQELGSVQTGQHRPPPGGRRSGSSRRGGQGAWARSRGGESRGRREAGEGGGARVGRKGWEGGRARRGEGMPAAPRRRPAASSASPGTRAGKRPDRPAPPATRWAVEREQQAGGQGVRARARVGVERGPPGGGGRGRRARGSEGVGGGRARRGEGNRGWPARAQPGLGKGETAGGVKNRAGEA